MKEEARETLSRQLKAGISDDQLAIVNEDEQPNKEPQIICSLGLKNK